MTGIVKKQYPDGICTYSISYDAGPDCGPMAGISLTGGVPVTVDGIDAVRFEQTIQGRRAHLKYDARPELAALVDEYKAIENQRAAEREAKYAAEKAADAVLLDEMNRKAAVLIAQIPADHVQVTVTQTGDLDGYPILEYEAEGIKLNWRDIENLGSASAIRPGALGAFAEVRVCSISRQKLAEIKTTQELAAAEKEAARAARQKELTETPIPESAMAAYNHYRGDSEAAWEAEDEMSWALIRRWTPYIEAQSGMSQDPAGGMGLNMS